MAARVWGLDEILASALERALESFTARGGEGVWVVTQTNRRTRAESQQIVATRPLYCLQYPVLSQSSAEDLPRRAFEIVMHGTGFRLVTLTGEPMDML